MKNLDYNKIGFSYNQVKYRYISKFKDGKWDEGTLSTDPNVILNESAAILQYCGQVFEGLKAYKTIDDRVVIFRPELNGQRLYDSACVMQLPPFPVDRFVDAVKQVVKANIDDVPGYDTGATLYLRPFIFGTNPILGVKPASEFEFRVYASPVGPYFSGDLQKKLFVPDFDRAAPHGTGHIKAGLNYAMSLRPYVLAHKNGYDENLYLDSATRTYIEETGGANVIFIDGDGKLVTPKSSTILPSITRRSLLQVAKDYLGLEVLERPIKIDELAGFKECGVCGTAAVISPVASVTYGDTVFDFKTGPIMNKLKETLLGIQKGKIKGPEGWVVEIK